MLTAAERAIPLASLESESEATLRRMRSLVADATGDADGMFVTLALAWVATACAWLVGASVVEGELFGLGHGGVWGSIVALTKYDPTALRVGRMTRTTINAPAVQVLAGAPLDGRLTTLAELRDLCPSAGRAAEECLTVDGAHIDPRILRWVCARLAVPLGSDQPVVVRLIPPIHAASVRLVPWLMIADAADTWRVCIAAEHNPGGCP